MSNEHDKKSSSSQSIIDESDLDEGLYNTRMFMILNSHHKRNREQLYQPSPPKSRPTSGEKIDLVIPVFEPAKVVVMEPIKDPASLAFTERQEYY